MQQSQLIGWLGIVLIVWAGCKPEINDPVVPGLPTQVISASQEGEGGYTVEMYLPWTVWDVKAEAGLELGFDLFMIDDDDGGLLDHKFAWKTETTGAPIPANFARLTLSEALVASEEGEVAFSPESLLIDGKSESVWDQQAPLPIAKRLKGTETDPNDMSGQFRAVWDSNALYLFIEITDEQLQVDSWSLPWEDDGIAVYLDPQLRRATELVQGETFVYRFLRSSNRTIADAFPIPPTWTVPILEVYDGGPGLDGIPALLNPDFIPASSAGYLRDSDLVIGYADENEARAYPHRILDWHEIVNDEVNGVEFAITYCPLTGTGIAWERVINGTSTTFGVSGLLHNSNLLPYDRLTGSNWSQMRLDCLEGRKQGEKATTIPIVETTWKTWKEMFPHTEVLSLETGYSRDYDRYPYGDYRSNHDALISPISKDDDRLPRKERVHGILSGLETRVYPFSRFLGGSTVLAHEVFEDQPIIIAGSKDRNFLVSFGRELTDGTVLSFTRVSSSDPSVIMQDQEGNEWNALGRAVSGPRMGTQLPSLDSYVGYWFAFGAFFPEVSIY